MISNSESKTDPKAFLIGISPDKTSLDELKELSKSCGLSVIGRCSQTRQKADPKFYLGKGKIHEVKETLVSEEVTVLIADDELSPAQHRHLEKLLSIKIMDRTGIVLEIFAQRAKTHEAQVQVELAQLDYLLPRLTRLWTHLSRTGGGIGTRGPGETQLETDKRLIKTRITHLKKQLKKVRQNRQTMKQKRQKIPLLTAAIVGYTNAGKSTLINALSDSTVLVEDKLFATLDPTSRQLTLPNKERLIITDTVGFIQKLPHQLVDAFMATLEEVIDSDFLIHVVDISNPNYKEMMHTTNSLFKELNINKKPQLIVYNKTDQLKNIDVLDTLNTSNIPHVCISALKKTSLEDLKKTMTSFLNRFRKKMTFHIPFDRMDIVNLLYQNGTILSEHYEKEIQLTVEINATIGHKIMGQLKTNSK
ncbi:GTPase HflX [Candidatus Marinamargulisbacteria bacterium SCGC AG-439-L15]|nr:GTPase HflX [Candidatus Marinamargulisbacteria bacterium SCGC AG-439-L15]